MGIKITCPSSYACYSLHEEYNIYNRMKDVGHENAESSRAWLKQHGI